MNHGLATSFRRCKDGPNGTPCPECVIAGREAANERKRKSRERLSEGVTETPTPKPLLTLVKGVTAGQSVDNTSHDHSPVPPSESHLDTPAVNPGAGRTTHEETSADYIWPNSVKEPSWATDHREFLASVIEKVIADPENYATAVEFTEDTSRKEKRDFDKLVKEFVKVNPGVIVYQWCVDHFEIHSPDYLIPEYEDYEETEESDLTNDAVPFTVAENASIREATYVQEVNHPVENDYKPLGYFMPRARGLCTISIDRHPWCENTADGTLFFQGHPCCKECFNILLPYYPGECTRKRLPRAQLCEG